MEETEGKDDLGRFTTGNNFGGRTKGSRNKRSIIKELLENAVLSQMEGTGEREISQFEEKLDELRDIDGEKWLSMILKMQGMVIDKPKEEIEVTNVNPYDDIPDHVLEQGLEEEQSKNNDSDEK